ncbi:MAG: hypothetical protein AVDCRST_MAG01-01-4880, partial [uncultured Rubrobacteraceae bacterium]
ARGLRRPYPGRRGVGVGWGRGSSRGDCDEAGPRPPVRGQRGRRARAPGDWRSL